MNPNSFIGKIIGNYQIKRVIGEGAYSTVFLAKEITPQSDEDLKDNNKPKQSHYVACKICPRTKIMEKKVSKSLEREIFNHKMMNHQNVVKLIDVQDDNLFYYIFLEFCVCGELFKIVIANGKLEEKKAAFYFKQILMGLQYIHSLNIAHRDLKPENILVDSNGIIKITDFGLSKYLDQNGFTRTPCGSPYYVSPECITGLPYDAKKSDIWSSGVILFAITTGFLPWSKKNKVELFRQIQKGEYKIPSHISQSCADLIYRLLTVDCRKRITIEEALNHPFLKDISVPKVKVETEKLMKNFESERPKMDSIIIEDIFRVRKEIQKEDEEIKEEIN